MRPGREGVAFDDTVVGVMYMAAAGTGGGDPRRSDSAAEGVFDS